MQKIAASLVKAQKEFGPALKTHTNPHFRSKYADLSAVVEAVIDALNNNGIFLSQVTRECEHGVMVETMFVHESGETWSSGPLHVPATKHDAQGYGSALTYARRYSLMSACGVAPEDDDGNAASTPAPKKQTKPVEKKWDRAKALDYIGKAQTIDEMKQRGRQAWEAAPNDEEKSAIAEHVIQLEQDTMGSA